jgi:putative transposase
VHRRFQEWTERGVFDKIVLLLLQWYDEVQGIAWQWQAGDTKLLPAPLGGEKTGPNPTDLGKSGTKRHLLVDGNGVPLALYLSAAQRHDVKGLRPLLTVGWLIARQPPEETGEQHICLDKAYHDQKMETFLEERGYITHIKQRGEDGEPGIGEPVYPPRRWKVERTISWLNNMRKLRTRWEKKAANYRALWLLACALVIFRRTVLG